MPDQPALSLEMQAWLERQAKTPEALNPCVRLFGRGPDGTICKTCRHLFSHRPGKKRFYKCDLRECTNGPGSDHRVRWPACAKYELKPSRTK
jgi:hypothetical protein